MHKNRVVRLPEHISELMRTGRIEYKYSEINIDKPNQEGKSLAESLPDTETKLFGEDDEQFAKLKRTIAKFLGYLKPKEQRVIELHYGLNGNDSTDVETIALQLSLTTTRIHQLLRSSMKKMQDVKHTV